MNVAIAAPSPVPFAMGGAESLFLGLQRHLNAETPHHCELVKLPSPEHDLRSVLASYEAFSRLDLSHFNAVVTTKYPAWMVRHPRQTVYLQHRLRGLYDTYHLTGLPTAPPAGPPSVERLRALMEEMGTDSAAHGRLPELFSRLREVGEEAGNPGMLAFPGPFAREIVHFLDAVGLSPGRVHRYAAISRTVRERDGYFPDGVDVAVRHHPSGLEAFRCGSDDYLFTASRLDGPKRVALLVEAMRHVKTDVPLLIAGTGPEEARLRELAGADARIRFLGFVGDRRLTELYADALGVLYVPFEEDYGLVTVEAMMSSKPVITTTDAGGPNELVRQGETGYSVPPHPRRVADAIEHLCEHRSRGREMGRAGRRVAERITWDRVVDTLLPEPAAPRVHVSGSQAPAPEKLVVATTFPIQPPRGGGQVRVFHLYRELARDREVHIVSLAPGLEPGMTAEIAPGLHEHRVTKSAEHEAREQEFSRSVGGVPVTDVAMPFLHPLTPAYTRTLARCAEGAQAVVASHPYAIEVICEAAPGVPLWYEAHNVELELKRQTLGRHVHADPLLRATEKAESRCWREAERVFGCSMEDLHALERLYGPTAASLVEVPNGVAAQEAAFTPPGERAALRERLGLGRRALALFMGSWHEPNLDAARQVIALAERLADIDFLIVGSVGRGLQDARLPGNVAVTDVVDDDEKVVLLSCADVALNPMTTGSGTNLKMLDYFAAGVPVLSTEVGIRGLSVVPDEHVFVAALADFPRRLEAILREGPAAHTELIASARQLAEEAYDWGVIARRFRRWMEEDAARHEWARVPV